MEKSLDYKLILASKKNIKNFSVLYNKYFDKIYTYIHNKIRHDDISGDLTQRVFMKGIAEIYKYEDRGFPYSSWLYKVASNEIKKYWRKNNKIQTIEITEKDTISFISELNEKDNTDTRDKLIKAINILSKEDEKAMNLLDLRFFEQKSFKEIGLELSISHGNAKIRTYRAIDKIRKIFNLI